MGVQHFDGEGPQSLWWACSWDARAKVTVSSMRDPV